MQQIERYHTKNQKISEGSVWFKRLIKECKGISQYIRFKRIKYGFHRIYFKQAYIHEVYKELPLIGYTKEERDPRFESKDYYQEYEDNAELTRKIKNYVEGYWDSIDRIRRRVYLMKNNKEFYKTASLAYRQTVVK